MLEIMLVSIVVNVLMLYGLCNDMVPGEQFILIDWLNMVR